MEDPPDCKYKLICKWYEGKTLWGEGCYELKCWRAIFLEDILPQEHLKTLELLINNGNKQQNNPES